MPVAPPVAMPNNNEKQDQDQRQRPPADPKPQPRQPQRDKGMNKRNEQKDLDQLDDDGSPLRGSDDDIEPTRPR